MSLPPQQPLVTRPTYSRTLSALRKTELIQLSVEFKLPTDGNVLSLRNRLRVYMNYHRDALINNPRYNGLFPRPRDPNIPIRQSDLPSRTFRTRSSSALSYDRTPSPALSYDSWHGIEDDPIPIPDAHPHQPPPQPLPPLPHHQEPDVHHHPPPSPSASESSIDSLPPAAYPAVGRKFVPLPIFLLLFPYFRGDTMESPPPLLFGTLWSSLLSYFLHLGDTMKSRLMGFVLISLYWALCSPSCLIQLLCDLIMYLPLPRPD